MATSESNETPITELLAELQRLYEATPPDLYAEGSTVFSRKLAGPMAQTYFPMNVADESVAVERAHAIAAWIAAAHNAFPRISRALIEAQETIQIAPDIESIERIAQLESELAEARAENEWLQPGPRCAHCDSRNVLEGQSTWAVCALCWNAQLGEIGQLRADLKAAEALLMEIHGQHAALECEGIAAIKPLRDADKTEIASLRAAMERTLSMLKSSLAGRAVVCADEAIAEAERALGKE